MRSRKVGTIFICAFIGFLLSSIPVFAASIILSGPSSTALNNELIVDVLVGREGQNVNAVEGQIAFPNTIFTVKEIRTGNSVVNFWVEEPHVVISSSSPSGKTGQISFSGITPGGFYGVLDSDVGEQAGQLFTITFRSHEQGSGHITLDSIRILLGDGEGTPANTRVIPLYVTVTKEASEDKKVVFRDLDPPESFHPEIANDESLFNNNYFLVFLTNDKESGVDHYEVMETEDVNGKEGVWVVASSPYQLKDQSLSNYIFVKALDRSSNERIEKVPPANVPSWNIRHWALITMFIIATAIVWVWLKR